MKTSLPDPKKKDPIRVISSADMLILYSTTDGKPASFTPDGVHHSAANVVSNKYDAKRECFVLKFDSVLTYLDDGAFNGSKNLKAIQLPDKINTIGQLAFGEARALRGVKLGTSTTTIKPYAFYQCEALETINFPKGLKSIAGFSFTNCLSLQSVTLPSTLLDIGTMGNMIANPFAGCLSLKEFKGSGLGFSTSDNRRFLSIDKGRLLLSTALKGFDLKTPCSIPKGTETIGTYALSSIVAEYIDLPQSVTKIEQGAFLACETDGRTITIPGGVSEISLNAFALSNIQGVRLTGQYLPDLPNNNAFGGQIDEDRKTNWPITITGAAAHNSASKLNDTKNQWFAYRSRITIEQGDSEIWYHTTDGNPLPFAGDFGGEPVGESFILNIDLNKIPSVRFEYEIAERYGNGQLTNGNIFIQLFDTPVTAVPDGAFTQQVTLDYMSLPSSVKTIGDQAFHKATSLQYFPVYFNTSLTSIGKHAFAECHQMTFSGSNALFLTSLNSIGLGAFYMCENFGDRREGLKSIIIFGQGLKKLPTNAFNSCKKISHIRFDGGTECLTSIASGAFLDCESLVQINSSSDSTVDIINLPNVTSIYGSTFRSCKSIKEIRLGALGSYVGLHTFSNCTSLERIICDTQNVTQIVGNSFNNCPNLVQVGTKANIIDFPSAATVGSNAFNGCSNIKSVHLGALQTIEAGTFLGCTSLEGVLLSSAQNLTTIKAQAFLDCQSLFALSDQVGFTQVRINSVTTIGVQAFENSGIRAFTALNASDIGSSSFKNCTKLQTVNIPAATTLHQSLFKGDVALTSVNAPKAITLQGLVFSGCTAISTLSLPAIQIIGGGAFEQTSLTTLKLGSDLSYLGTHLFDGCTNSGQMNIYFAGGVPRQTEADAFTIIGNSVPYTFNTIYVLQEYIQDFENAWQNSYGQYAIWDGVF